jgi:hypothetical protein
MNRRRGAACPNAQAPRAHERRAHAGTLRLSYEVLAMEYEIEDVCGEVAPAPRAAAPARLQPLRLIPSTHTPALYESQRALQTSALYNPQRFTTPSALQPPALYNPQRFTTPSALQQSLARHAGAVQVLLDLAQPWDRAVASSLVRGARAAHAAREAVLDAARHRAARGRGADAQSPTQSHAPAPTPAPAPAAEAEAGAPRAEAAASPEDPPPRDATREGAAGQPAGLLSAVEVAAFLDGAEAPIDRMVSLPARGQVCCRAPRRLTTRCLLSGLGFILSRFGRICHAGGERGNERRVDCPAVGG